MIFLENFWSPTKILVQKGFLAYKQDLLEIKTQTISIGHYTCSYSAYGWISNMEKLSTNLFTLVIGLTVVVAPERAIFFKWEHSHPTVGL